MSNLSSLETVLIGLLVAGLVPLGLAYFGATGLGTLDTTALALLHLRGDGIGAAH